LQHAVCRAGLRVRNQDPHQGFSRKLVIVDARRTENDGIIVPVTTTVNITCEGTDERPHLDDVRTAAQFHDKYATSWELTSNFGSGFGSERKLLRVPEAEHGDDTRMRVVISCPDPLCTFRKTVRWEKLHAELDKARDHGYSRIPIKLLTED
jgi:hypothetical protein